MFSSAEQPDSHKYVVVEAEILSVLHLPGLTFLPHIQLKYIEVINIFTETVTYCSLTLWVVKLLLKFIVSVKSLCKSLFPDPFKTALRTLRNTLIDHRATLSGGLNIKHFIRVLYRGTFLVGNSS